MIANDDELKGTRERIAYFEDFGRRQQDLVS